ncbi:MAG TPA: PilZ domain-containing protein [Solirubrobacteraceae bacterium]|nr:PilZ domain-containing protein [Solirubrobacteraceae bacterium]
MTAEPEPTGQVIRLNVGGTEGKLSTPVGSQIPVRVYERGDFLMLVLMLDAAGELIPDAAEELAPEAAESLIVEYVSPRGVVRFRGQAVLQERDLVRFEVSAAPEITQRREFVRVPALQNVALRNGEGLDGNPTATRAIDLSGGGMLLGGADHLELESVVRFTLDLGAGMSEVAGLARVVRADSQGRRALVFEQISAEDREELIHFVFARQRDALAKLGRKTRTRRAG